MSIREITQRLRVFTALAKDLGSIPTWRLRTTIIHVPRDPTTSPTSVDTRHAHGIQIYVQTKTPIHIKKNLFKKVTVPVCKGVHACV